MTQSANGTYQAAVQIWDDAGRQWVDKSRESNFFPADWPRARIEYEVTEAFEVREPNQAGPGTIGASRSGIDIRFNWDTKSTNHILSIAKQAMNEQLQLIIQPSKRVGMDGRTTRQRSINIVDERGDFADRFFLLAAAMDDDIPTAEGAGVTALREIERIESGEVDKIEADGNAWVTHITRDKVWFESLYSQGEGGEVSFAQYKLAVQTYVRFLADPERKPVEVPFPEF